jgi:hypothetical protein
MSRWHFSRSAAMLLSWFFSLLASPLIDLSLLLTCLSSSSSLPQRARRRRCQKLLDWRR